MTVLRNVLARQAATVAALALLALAMVMPPVMVARQVQSYLVAFDITQSMGVTDVSLAGAPATRLDFAKATLRQTLRHLPCGSRVAWAVFTDYRTLPLMEPLEVCEHFDALRASLDFIDPRMRWANASNIAKGVYWTLRATRAIEDNSERDAADTSAVITVFVSDGQEAPPSTVGESSSLLMMDKPMPGLLVGVGQQSASPIPRTDNEGRVIATWRADEVVQRNDVPAGSSHEELSALHEAHLKALAERHGLGYVRMTDADALQQAMRAAGPSRTVQQATDLRWAPIALALALLVWPPLRACSSTVIARLRRVRS